MKKHSLLQIRNLLPVWLAFTGAILVAFAVSLIFAPGIKFSTSLFDILPPSSGLVEIQKADTILAETTGRTITILVKNQDFTAAKKSAEKLYEYYSSPMQQDFFDEISLYADSDAIQEITDWIQKWKFNLLDEDSVALINDAPEDFQEDSLGRIFGAFSLADYSVLYEDPFLLSGKELTSLLEGGILTSTSMAPKDDVLACEYENNWYVLIRAKISQSGSSLTNSKSTIKNLYAKCLEIESDSDSEFIFSGVPFHSYDNSSSAQKQITIISIVSLAAIVVVFFWIFKSLFPAIISSLAVMLSCGIGFVSVLLFFREIHVLTFVFGTTLIGTCLDYSIHYFINWKYNSKLQDGISIRNHIFKGVGLGFVSTEICFVFLFLSPFPLLRQVSVFLFTGLATSFLTVICIYPFFKVQEKIEFKKKFRFLDKLQLSKFRRFKRCVPLIFVAFYVMTFCTLGKSLKIHNDITTLYSMSDKMLNNEILSSKILNTGSSGWYFLVKADSDEELLQKNEVLDEILRSAVNQGRLESFLSISQFVKSNRTQKESYDSIKKLLPYVPAQYEFLDFPQEASEEYARNFLACENRYFGIEEIPETMSSAVKSIYIGEVDGKYYSCVLPLHVSQGEETFFKEIAEENAGIYFVNKVKDISGQLDVLSKTMLILLGIAFVVIIGLLLFVYPGRIVVKIAIVPFVVFMTTISALLVADIPVSFFPVTSLVLVFGLGLDYIIYKIEGLSAKNEKSELNDFAILLSFITTALSFGALALSSFPPVHVLGFTVFVGLVTAVLTALTVIDDK